MNSPHAEVGTFHSSTGAEKPIHKLLNTLLPYSMKVFDGDDTNEQQNISSQGEIKSIGDKTLSYIQGLSHTDDWVLRAEQEKKTKNP